ncbi:class I adenylate-forming enzyme family protein [Mycolicibacterium pyrenivorans]|uniref:class I adenylate-forming enzyme family protein n=1 Tax=Mycolicibacterium pyrenivorans TaxID=187102 RepID=UPI0021F3AC9F|nr:AMP-binding protein [Mycolicibacterium pyrenivorans]MCV7149955.1 AMP-binding protein [Mycolicibacterium pyrenivorans]
MNVSILLDMVVDGMGDRPLLGRKGQTYTASEVSALCDTAAASLTAQDVKALVYLDINGPCFTIALFAAARAGIPLVPLNYRQSTEQMAGLLAKHPGALVITSEQFEATCSAAGLKTVTSDDWLAKLAANPAGSPYVAAEDPAAPAAIIYTSGTTSEPKGVVLRHENLTSYVMGSVEFAGASDSEAALVSVPPYHIAAVANAITNFYAGRRAVVLEQFSGEEWLEVVRSEEITNALVVPTMLARIIDADGDHRVPSLRTLSYGGAAMPRRVIEKALAEWQHVGFVNAYGLTETSSTIAVLGPEDHRAAVDSADQHVRDRLGSAGQVLPTVEIEIRGADGTVLSAGEVGRIWVRGEQVSGEYSGTGSVLDGSGYFDTRDEGYIDADGYLFVGGRADDTIIRGGENIAPAEIEAVLLAHEAVADAVVVGVADIEWGQRLEAVIVRAPNTRIAPDDLREFVRTRLRGSKTPDTIHVWHELPRTETGKLVRRHVLAKLNSTSELSS